VSRVRFAEVGVRAVEPVCPRRVEDVEREGALERLGPGRNVRRDMADGDYISARLACRAVLIPQFLWAAQQALEKYLKYLLLVNRIPETEVRHNILSALELPEDLPFKIELRPQSLKFIKHIATYGEYRYLDISYFVRGYVLLDLDMAIWDLRRYCQVLDVRGKQLPLGKR